MASMFCIVGFDNMMTNTKMSIFNKYTNPTTKNVVYKKHLIDEVFWDDSLGINLNMGYEKADKVNVFIPFDKNDMSGYVEPKQYTGEGWTIQNGDFIIKGDVAETQVSGIKDLKSYECLEVTVVDIKDFGSYNMQHFEIRGQ